MNHIKTISSILLMLFMVLMMVMLFLFRDSIIGFTSKGFQGQMAPEDHSLFTDSVNQMYNYTNGSETFNFTLFEFHANGCISCRKMKKVLAGIQDTHSKQIKVVTMNMTTPKGLQWGKFFGVVMIPTQIILDKSGKEIFRNTGFISKEDLLSRFEINNIIL